MLKNVEKKKILLSLGVIVLTILLLGNISAYATDGSTLTITPTTSNTQNTGATSNTNTNTNTNTGNTNTNTNTANTSNYSNTSSTVASNSNLPYTGSSSKTVLLVVALVISAIYAYKKVSDYNV